VRLQFGPCTLDLETRELICSEEPIHLEPKAFRLLELLVLARPRALSKDELQKELWPKVFVSEHNLARLVLVLRTRIGDDARTPRFIRTVHGFGYAFSGKVSELHRRQPRAAASIHCRLVWGEREIALAEGESILGRDPEAVVWIDRSSVSRRHARIVISGDTVTVEDLGSKNGTFLSGRRIAKPVPLVSGDEIRIGSARLVFRIFGSAATTASKVTR
jgi:DNA-binding winged helix-turn-helix (wHTH) protein